VKISYFRFVVVKFDNIFDKQVSSCLCQTDFVLQCSYKNYVQVIVDVAELVRPDISGLMACV